MCIILGEAWTMLRRTIRVNKHGFENHGDTDEDICRDIINKCYEYKDRDQQGYFLTSTGNYIAFYSRDFGWCIESLINLGYRKKVHDTLRYAIGQYARYSGITVAINQGGVPFNFPNIYSPDSVAYFFRSLRIAGAKDIILKYREFLNSEIQKYARTVIDEKSGIVRRKIFSGMRDHVRVKSSCYDMIMSVMLYNEIDLINKMLRKDILINPLKKHHLRENLIKHYWNGNYFRNNPEHNLCTGHCNTYPYILGVITDKKMMLSSTKSIQENHLEEPIPLQYGYDIHTKFIWQGFFAMDWEKDTSWSVLGLSYITMLYRIDKRLAKKHLEQFKKNIEKYHGFIELYKKDGTPYRSLFYTADNSMLWASMYLDLKRQLKT
jgi:hypothetical protein